MEPTTHLRLDVFELKFVPIDSVDQAQLHALSIAVGWPHRASDWQILRDLGFGFAVIDEIGRVIGSVVWNDYGPDTTMIGMMITSPRLQEQGAGRWLMSEVMTRKDGRAFALTATSAARRLYRSLGFGFERTVQQFQGEAAPTAENLCPPGAEIRTLGAEDREAVLDLDRRATGIDRARVLDRLLAESGGVLLRRDGRPAAYSLCRPFGRGHVVGPVVAASDPDAIAVVAPHVEARAGTFLRSDTPVTGGPYPAFLARSGLVCVDTVTSMGIGREPFAGGDPGGLRRYGLASQALG